MDTSETYIKMCEKAVEIQGCKFGETGDFVVARQEIQEYQGWWTVRKGVLYVVGNDGEYDVSNPSSEDFIWLPRQDQLQEMVRPIPKYGDKVSPYNLSWSFYQFVHQSNPKERGDTFEQLWLAFVMKEKYNKTWNGEDWVGQ